MTGVTTVNWGPIPTFAARLAATVPRRPNGWRRPLAATRPFGGPWGLLARGRWTDQFPPIRTPGPPWLVALFGLLRFQTNPGTPFASDAELAAALADVHRFLVVRNARLLAEVLPGPAALPPPLLNVSATGLAWALWAFELAEHGPTNPVRTPVPVGPQDWPVPPTPGDSLSLHLWIEDMVAGADVPDPPPTVRPLGGLRRASFLQKYPHLVEAPDPRTRQRGVAARMLLALSPLSQWVYADLVPPHQDLNGASAVAAFGGGTSADLQAANDGWQSLLCRSLVAALLGPTPAWERRTVAEDDYADHRGQRFDTLSVARRKELLDRVEDVRQETRMEGILRPPRLAEMIASAGPGGALLALRTMDMLVRQLAQSTAPLLLRDRAADPDRLTLSDLVMSSGNRLFRRLKEAVFGGAAVADFGDLSARHRELTERLIVPPLPTDSALGVIADAAGVSLDAARRVRDRFARAGIALPHAAKDGNPRTPTPMELLARWCETMTPPPDAQAEPPPPPAPADKEYANER